MPPRPERRRANDRELRGEALGTRGCSEVSEKTRDCGAKNVALVLRIETLACTERCSQHSAPLVQHTIASIPCEGQVVLSDTNTQELQVSKTQRHAQNL